MEGQYFSTWCDIRLYWVPFSRCSQPFLWQWRQVFRPLINFQYVNYSSLSGVCTLSLFLTWVHLRIFCYQAYMDDLHNLRVGNYILARSNRWVIQSLFPEFQSQFYHYSYFVLTNLRCFWKESESVHCLTHHCPCNRILESCADSKSFC